MANKRKCKYRQQRIENGLCDYCGKHPPLENKLSCAKCSDKRKLSKKKMRNTRQSLGLCVECGELRFDGSKLFCEKCYETCRKNTKIRTERYKLAGVCTYCGKNPLISDKMCSHCLLKRLARAYLGSIKKVDELVDLFNRQNGKCAYLKVPIVVGVDASIDHIIPKIAGGKNDINNLQWVHKIINNMKWTMTHDEFINTVHVIAKANPKNE